MKKYIAIGISGIISVIIWLIIPSDSYAYLRGNMEDPFPPSCNTILANAVASVYPDVDTSSFLRWQCDRRNVCTATDPNNPNNCLTWNNNVAICRGKYKKDLSPSEWWNKVKTDGFNSWKPVLVDRDLDKVTVERETKAVVLDSTQFTAHAPLFSNDCLLDHNGVKLAWLDLLQFYVERKNNSIIIYHVIYATTEESDILGIAEAALEGKAIAPLQEAP